MTPFELYEEVQRHANRAKVEAERSPTRTNWDTALHLQDAANYVYTAWRTQQEAPHALPT